MSFFGYSFNHDSILYHSSCIIVSSTMLKFNCRIMNVVNINVLCKVSSYCVLQFHHFVTYVLILQNSPRTRTIIHQDSIEECFYCEICPKTGYVPAKNIHFVILPAICSCFNTMQLKFLQNDTCYRFVNRCAI